jgi:hypothetical protein
MSTNNDVVIVGNGGVTLARHLAFSDGGIMQSSPGL